MNHNKHTLRCQIQNRLGAMDRLLGTLTMRGYMPEQLNCTTDAATDTMQVVMTFTTQDDRALEKLVKAMHRQVYVMDIQIILAEEEDPVAAFSPTAKVAPLFVPLYVERRAASAQAQ
jgi:acetolactate synthase small subunit